MSARTNAVAFLVPRTVSLRGDMCGDLQPSPANNKKPRQNRGSNM